MYKYKVLNRLEFVPLSYNYAFIPGEKGIYMLRGSHNFGNSHPVHVHDMSCEPPENRVSSGEVPVLLLLRQILR